MSNFGEMTYLCSLNSNLMSHFELSEQEILRRESLQKLRDLGIDPYPAALYPVDAYASNLKQDFEDGKEVCLSLIHI
jgi:hypothetical protein